MSPVALQQSMAETVPRLFECSPAPQGGFRVHGSSGRTGEPVC